MTHKCIAGFARGIKYISSALTPDRLAYWMKVPKWTSDEAAALLCEVDPGFVEMFPDEMTGEVEFSDLRRLVERAAPRDFQGGAPPARWLALAKELIIPIPAELKRQVERFWPEERSAGSAADETACKKYLIAMMRSAPDNPRPKVEVRQTQFNNLQKRLFNRAWASAVQSANTPKWSAAGRRKKSSLPFNRSA